MAKVVKQWASDDGKVWNTKKEAQDQDFLIEIGAVIQNEHPAISSEDAFLIADALSNNFIIRRKKPVNEG